MDSSSQSLLLVEDDNRVSDFLMEGFCEEGFTVTRAPDGQAALDALTTSTYDCIILDLIAADRRRFASLPTNAPTAHHHPDSSC